MAKITRVQKPSAGQGNSDQSQSPNTSDKKKILIVGDWVVDENWMVTTENSPTSSHVGKQQFRSVIENPEAQILSLCGAGSIALMLCGALKEKADIYGLGLWDPDDTQLLASLFADEVIPHQTPHSLEGMHVGDNQSIDPLKFGPICGQSNKDCLSNEHTACERLFSISDKGLGTWRVLRVYKQAGGAEPQLLHRYDWEIPKERLDAKTLKDLEVKIDENLDKIQCNFDVVVIVDHNKGVVTKGMIEKIFKHPKCADARWYVRCKNHEKAGDWLETIKNKLKLILVGPNNLNLEDDKWFYGHHLSMGAINFLVETGGGTIRFKPGDVIDPKYLPGFAVVALHSDNRIAALVPHSMESPNHKIHQEISCSRFPKALPIRVGRHSVLFASLIKAAESKVDDYIVNKGDLENALEASHKWCKDTQQALKDNNFWGRDKESKNRIKFENSFRGKYRRAIETDNTPPAGGEFKLEERGLQKSCKAWKSAFDYNEYGTLLRESDGKSHKFQIWRGWSPVSNFISLIPQCRKEIGDLKQAVQSFVSDAQPKRSLSAFIVGSPGWGKSHLVECLAKEMDMGFQEFNITHLASVYDLISCFDTISSLQTQNPDRPLMIFWDEINALLAGQHAYGYFLSPLWNGTYRRGSLTFRLQPCVWIFAGTHDLTQDQEEKAQSDREEGVKGSDFMSRINGPIVHLRADYINERGLDGTNVYKISEQQLEQVYIAVSLIKAKYPDISTISRGVLEFFRDAELIYGIRSLEMVISRLRNVSHGKLTEDNLPLDKIDDFKLWIEVQGKKWQNEKTEDIKIYGEPPNFGK